MRDRSDSGEFPSVINVTDSLAIESDASLARRIVANESGAFAAFVERHHGFVFRICFRILRHREDAEDATQDTFSRVARYLHRWDPRRPLEPWLATVAGNRSRTQLARRKHHASLTAVAEPQTHETDEDRAADAVREEIGLAMAGLPERQRMAFTLFHERSLSYAEIADRMGCPVGTVKTLVHRARLAMIDQLRRRDVIPSRSSEVSQPPSPPGASPRGQGQATIRGQAS